MIIYRQHCGTLSEAMKTVVEFNDIDEMKQYIVNQWTESFFGRAPFSVEDIVITDEVLDDHRIGWHDTRHVCVRRFGNQDFIKMYTAPQCIGWCASEYEK